MLLKFAVLSALLLSPLAVLGDGPARPWAVAGLELTEPQTRTKPGFAKVTAKLTAEKTAKVKVKWKVRAQFEDSDVEFDYEVVANGLAVQVVVPDSKGLIEVTAIAVIDGEPTEFAETSVTVDYRPRLPRDKPAPAVLPKEEATKDRALPREKAKGAVKFVYLIADLADGDPDVLALVKSQGLKNKIKAAGAEPALIDALGPGVQKLGLERFVKDAGGAPCVVFVTEQRLVRKAMRLTRESKQEDVLKEVQR